MPMERLFRWRGTIATRASGYLSARPIILSFVRLLFLGVSALPSLKAAPTSWSSTTSSDSPQGKSPADPALWIYLAIAVVLVLLGGIFAGLTIALMGQDDVNLQVIHESGEGKEKDHAGRVLQLLQRGKHWVLVTLLLSNVITNETLPIVLDRSLGGGWPAILGSTALIVIFGEVIPQSICVRYGLRIGAWMAPLVLGLMYLLSPIAWPTAKLLDWLLGEDRGNIYKKAGLKTLVTLHKTLGTSANERLNEDEVTIISAVLDLKDKAVGSIMTPMEDTFTLSADTVLDEKMMDTIFLAGYSRIPIHAPDNDQNFIGMLLVKTLITYDPEDAVRVSEFALATLPETRSETSCLDIVNFFQEGKSHMVLVSEFPGDDHGALGVVTLEDVIEELIGEEIIDESDVYVDVHNAVRRKTQAPQARVGTIKASSNDHHQHGKNGADLLVDFEDDQTNDHQADAEVSKERRQTSRTDTTTSATSLESNRLQPKPVRSLNEAVWRRGSAADLRTLSKHLGPSNPASRPRQTRYQSVKIKPGSNASDDGRVTGGRLSEGNSQRRSSLSTDDHPEAQTVNPAGKPAKDGVLAVQKGYGSIMSPKVARSGDGGGVGSNGQSATNLPNLPSKTKQLSPSSGQGEASVASRSQSSSSNGSRSTLGALPDRSQVRRGRKLTVRSGNITENVVEAGGIRKVVLEPANSPEEGKDGESSGDSSPNGKGEISMVVVEGRKGNQGEDDSDDGNSNEGDGLKGSSDHDGRMKKQRQKPSRNDGERTNEQTPLLKGG